MVAPADEKRSASLMKALTRQLLRFLLVGELVGFSSGALNAAEMPSPARRSESGRTEDQTHLAPAQVRGPSDSSVGCKRASPSGFK